MTTAPALLIYCCPLDAVDEALLASYHTLLSADEQIRAANLRRDAVRKVFLISRALLRTTLASHCDCDPAALVFRRDHNDKPQLHAPAAPWQFNLSHAGAWVVLALSNAGAVGVDVEMHERRNQLAGIARRFYTPAENIALARLAEPEWSQRFFELWTLKEAYVKALGRGIATALAGTDIEYADASTVHLHLSGAARCAGSVRCWHYQLTPQDSLAATVIGNESSVADLQPRLFNVVPLQIDSRALALSPRLIGNIAPVR